MGQPGTRDPGLLVLISLAAGPKHGHAILLDIRGFTGTTLGPGTLYGALARLEENGQIEPMPAEGRRRPYRLTDAGRRMLRGQLSGLEGAVRVGIERTAAT
jgi:DNA-binding PadR family transcriptional regulator